MEKKALLTAAFISALLFSAVAGTMFVNLATANPMACLQYITIKSDGSIEPQTEFIKQDGNVYTLTGNISAVIQVQRSFIIIDGAGYTLQGDGHWEGRGLEVVGCNNVTIRNLNIKGFTRGIRFTNSFDCIIYQNILANNTIGIEMGYVDDSYSNNNTVSGNIIIEGVTGIRLIHGSSNTICRNIITANNFSGIAVWGTSGNNIIWNNITNNNNGIYFETSGINIIHHNNFVNNTNDWWDYGLTDWPFQLPFSVNIWDDGKEGNYWGAYNGADSDGNGIGDTPHKLYENNTDNYPLMESVIIPEFPSSTPFQEPTSTPEPFPTTLVVASVITVAVVGVVLLFYFKKRKH